MMAKEDAIKTEAVVVDLLPNAMFRVKSNHSESTILCTLSGRMRQNNIRVALADRVEVELSVYDLQRGRIVRRL